MNYSKKLQVFVSSTYRDLREERQAAVEAILKAGHIPAGMELFTAGNQSQLQTINRWIAQCDAYMLILGGRYGSIEPDSGISYTELEYDYAANIGKPLFAVVIEDSALIEKSKILGPDALELENPALLKQFREKVLKKMSSFYRDSKDIKLCIYESLADISADNDLAGWIYAADIPDISSMNAKIDELTIENDNLKKAKAEREKTSPSNSEIDYSDLVEILKETVVRIPAELANHQEDIKRSLLEIFIKNQEALISGVTNQHDANETEIFYYYNIMPKLQVYGLAVNEKVVGVRYRRSYITQAGLNFLARTNKKLKVKPANESGV
jgi:Domain of unknown function (DUF4062)